MIDIIEGVDNKAKATSPSWRGVAPSLGSARGDCSWPEEQVPVQEPEWKLTIIFRVNRMSKSIQKIFLGTKNHNFKGA